MGGNGVTWSLFMPEAGGVKAYCKETFQLSKPYGKERLYLIRAASTRDPADYRTKTPEGLVRNGDNRRMAVPAGYQG